MIADQLKEWRESRACDRYVAGGLDDFVDRVVGNCSAAASSAANTKAAPRARIPASLAPKTAFHNPWVVTRASKVRTPRSRRAAAIPQQKSPYFSTHRFSRGSVDF
jgi:hypothetical protein